jgi:hypothetical protein
MEPKPPNINMQDVYDREQLGLLAIFYYVLAGISVLVGCFPVIHLTVGLLFLGGAVSLQGDSPDRAPVALIGGFFVGIAAIIIFLSWTQALLLYLTGRNLQNCRNHLFCMIIAGITCLNFPLGTILGVFTIIVLQRESVRAKFMAGDQPFAFAPPKF